MQQRRHLVGLQCSLIFDWSELKRISNNNLLILTAKFGTTPEKLAEGRNVLYRDAAESKAPLKSPSYKKAIPSNTTPSNATFPAQPSKAVPQFFSSSKSSAAAFPPMPTRSPKPLSQSLNQNVSAAPTLPKPTSPPAKAGNDVDYKSMLAKFYETNAPAKVGDIDSTLQKYKVRETQ